MRRSGGDLLIIVGGEMAERGAWSGRIRIGIGGERERKAKLLEILLIGEREVLVEPLGHEHFRRRSPMRAAVGKLDACAHENLRRLGERDHAEPKGQAQAHLPFVEAHFSNGECGCGHVNNSVWKAIVRALPRRSPFDLPKMIKENRRCVMLGNWA